MTINIYISKEDLLRRVRLLTAYNGAKTDEAGRAYKRIAAVRIDAGILRQHLAYALTQLREEFRPFEAMPTTESDDAIIASLQLPERASLLIDKTLQEHTVDYLAHEVISRWYMAAAKDEANAYVALAKERLAKIHSALWFRAKPTRTRIVPPQQIAVPSVLEFDARGGSKTVAINAQGAWSADINTD